MDRNGTWGTDKEVHAFAHLLNTPVCVYNIDSNHGDHEWQVFNPDMLGSVPSQDTTDMAMYIRQQGQHFEVVLGTVN